MEPLEATLPAPGEEQGQEVVVAEQHEVAPAGDPLLSALLAIARDPNANIAAVRELREMMKEEREYQAKQRWNEAMAATQAAIEPVVKDANNTQTKSKYARLEAINKAIAPIYTEAGFSLTFDQGETEKQNHIRVLCDVSNSGFTKSYHMDVPIDATGIQGSRNKTDTHAFASSLTYGRRLLTCAIFNVATEDDDGNAAGSGAAITQDEADNLRDLVGAIDRSEEQFIAYANARLGLSMKTLGELPANKLQETRNFLLSIKQKQEAAE